MAAFLSVRACWNATPMTAGTRKRIGIRWTFDTRASERFCLKESNFIASANRPEIAQKAAHSCALDVHHAHVRHVEHAAIVAHLMVFVDLRTVVDRHVPAAEIDHLCAHRAVCGIEGCLLKSCHIRFLKKVCELSSAGEMPTNFTSVQTYPWVRRN